MDENLKAEINLLSCYCEDTKEKGLWNNILDAQSQLNHIAQSLSLLDVSFAQMYKIGQNHGIDKQNDEIRNIVTNYLFFVEDILRYMIEDSHEEHEIDRFMDSIHLDSLSHDAHFSIYAKSSYVDFKALNTNDIVDFYKLAVEIDKEEELYKYLGYRFDSNSSSKDFDAVLLQSAREGAKKLIKKNRCDTI